MLESLELRNNKGVVAHLVSELLLLLVSRSDLLQHALALFFHLVLLLQVHFTRVGLHALLVVSVSVSCELPDEDTVKLTY